MTHQVEFIPLEKDVWTNSRFDKITDALTKLDTTAIAILHVGEVVFNQDEQTLIRRYEEINAEIVFASSAYFHFQNQTLFSYYWKYYPRQKTPNDFIHPDFLMGTVAALIEMLKDAAEIYFDNGEKEYASIFNRLFVDSSSGFLKTSYRVKIDYNHRLFGNTNGRQSVVKWPLISKIHAYLFFHYEKERLAAKNLNDHQNAIWDYQIKDGKWFNRKTNETPALCNFKQHDIINGSRPILTSFQAYFKSLLSLATIFTHNLGQMKMHKIFRFTPNRAPELKNSINKLVSLLEENSAFCFSHFNDGELTFISKYKKGNHKEVWFGRRQNQYNEKLGRLLVEAFLLKRENYFVGVPCKKSHPRLREKADKLRKGDEFTIPAMTLHHNIYLYPKMLGILKQRKLYFVVNPYQDLTFFESLGLAVTEDQTIRVPFKNSHLEYDKLEDHTFEDGAVVLLMCGMLGKVLMPKWFENSPKTTFLTFGSSFDDMIQKNINFRLLPAEAPFARHIIGTRSFLFGAKPKCKECFDIENVSHE